MPAPSNHTRLTNTSSASSQRRWRQAHSPRPWRARRKGRLSIRPQGSTPAKPSGSDCSPISTARSYSSAAALGPALSKAMLARWTQASMQRSSRDEALQDPSRFPVGAASVQLGRVRHGVEVPVVVLYPEDGLLHLELRARAGRDHLDDEG